MSFYLSDTLNFISKLSFKKAWNVTKLYASYQLTKLRTKPVVWGLPMTVSFEPTTACNLKCPECPSGLRSFSRATGNLKPDFFRQSINQLSDTLLYLIFYFQGEPFINPAFLDMVKYAADKNIYTITSTNAHFITDNVAKRTVQSGLDRMIISIDGTTQEVYEQYRKEGSLEKVIEGTKNMVKWKNKLNSQTPHLIFQFLVVKPNEHQIDEVYSLAQKIGVDEVKLKSAQVYDYKNGNPLIPTQEKYARYAKQKDGSYAVKNNLINHCWKLWHACVITWNGTIVPCCFDKDAKYEFGSLQNDSFKHVWQNEKADNFRSQIRKGRDKIDICSNCTEGCKVWVDS